MKFSWLKWQNNKNSRTKKEKEQQQTKNAEKQENIGYQIIFVQILACDNGTNRRFTIDPMFQTGFKRKAMQIKRSIFDSLWYDEMSISVNVSVNLFLYRKVKKVDKKDGKFIILKLGGMYAKAN